MGSSQQFSLRWNNYLQHITGAFDTLRTDEDLVDVTLSCEGKKIRAHKVLLSACSPYFRDLFKENPCQHPVIIFKDVKFSDLEALVQFMYKGKVNVIQDQLSSFLITAELLAIQGLTDGAIKDSSKTSNDNEVEENDLMQTLESQELKELDASSIVTNEGPCSVIKKRKYDSVGGISSDNSMFYNNNNSVNNNLNSNTVSAVSVLNSLEKEIEHRKAKDIRPAESIKIEIPDYLDQDSVELDVYSDCSTGIEHRESITSDKKDSICMLRSNSRLTSLQTLLQASTLLGSRDPVLIEGSTGTETVDDNRDEMRLAEHNLKMPSFQEFISEAKGEINVRHEEENGQIEELQMKEDSDPYFGCETCRESKSAKKDSVSSKCPICGSVFSAPCLHLLKAHMRDVHGWFNVQRRFPLY